MDAFAENRNIQLQHPHPHHPNSNPVETFMKTLGKAVKTDFQEKKYDKETVQGGLQSYRQTLHPSTEIAPADMLFRNGIKTTFPRKKLTEEQVIEDKCKDIVNNSKNENALNSSNYFKKE